MLSLHYTKKYLHLLTAPLPMQVAVTAALYCKKWLKRCLSNNFFKNPTIMKAKERAAL
jgi:hypothetical protein